MHFLSAFYENAPSKHVVARPLAVHPTGSGRMQSLKFTATTLTPHVWKTNAPNMCQLGVFERPLTLRLLQKRCGTNGSHIVIQTGGAYSTFCKGETYICKTSRQKWEVYHDIFQKYQGQGVDVTLLNKESGRRAYGQQSLNMR